jgi:hypothetical protein
MDLHSEYRSYLHFRTYMYTFLLNRSIVRKNARNVVLNKLLQRAETMFRISRDQIKTMWKLMAQRLTPSVSLKCFQFVNFVLLGKCGTIFKSQESKNVGWERKVFPKRRQGIATIRYIITPKSAVLIYFRAEAWYYAWFRVPSNRCKQKQNACRPNNNQSYKGLFPMSSTITTGYFEKWCFLTKQYGKTPFKKPTDSVQIWKKLRDAEFFSFRKQHSLWILITRSSLCLDIPNGLCPTSKWICWR